MGSSSSRTRTEEGGQPAHGGVGHSVDTLNHVLGEFADLSAMSAIRRPLITAEETREQIVKTAADQIAVVGTLTSGPTASVHVREAVAGGIGLPVGNQWNQWNAPDHGRRRVTRDLPLTIAGARGGGEPAQLAVPAAL